jgi:Na+-translocating ferredoxin:NAD+ oxidoreductase subunit G
VSENGKMLLVMTLFALVAGLLLAWTNQATRVPIQKARMAETVDALKRVMPPCDNDIQADARVVHADGHDWNFYVGRRAGVFAGAAFQSEADGYGGKIRVLTGLLPDGTVNSVEVLQADNETPGLGSKIKGEPFRRQFAGKRATDTRWAAVTRDGGAIQAITGATISSRAVARAVKAGLDVYAQHTDEIRGGGK